MSDTEEINNIPDEDVYEDDEDDYDSESDGDIYADYVDDSHFDGFLDSMPAISTKDKEAEEVMAYLKLCMDDTKLQELTQNIVNMVDNTISSVSFSYKIYHFI